MVFITWDKTVLVYVGSFSLVIYGWLYYQNVFMHEQICTTSYKTEVYIGQKEYPQSTEGTLFEIYNIGKNDNLVSIS